MEVRVRLWRSGTRVSVFDQDRRWRDATILRMDGTGEDALLLLHFIGWSARCDTWFPIGSKRLRSQTSAHQAAAMPGIHRTISKGPVPRVRLKLAEPRSATLLEPEEQQPHTEEIDSNELMPKSAHSFCSDDDTASRDDDVASSDDETASMTASQGGETARDLDDESACEFDDGESVLDLDGESVCEWSRDLDDIEHSASSSRWVEAPSECDNAQTQDRALRLIRTLEDTLRDFRALEANQALEDLACEVAASARRLYPWMTPGELEHDPWGMVMPVPRTLGPGTRRPRYTLADAASTLRSDAWPVHMLRQNSAPARM